MKQALTLTLVLLVFVLAGPPKIYGEDCYPTSTISSAQNLGCNLNTAGAGSPSIFKQEHRIITFPIGMFETTAESRPYGFGSCAVKIECSNKNIVECWPKFNTPIAIYNYWSQDIYNQKADSFEFLNMCCCPPVFAMAHYISCIDDGLPVTFEADGPCTGSGGGAGGSGGNDGGTIGIGSCTNYYWVTDYYDCPDGWTNINQCNYMYSDTDWAGCW